MKQYLLNILLVALPQLLMAQGQQAVLLGTWDDPSVPGSSAYNNRYNEIWGVAVNNREFAIIGSTMGTHFIDVTNPAAPVQVAFMPGKAQGPGIVHRDYKTYQHYIYAVCDEGESSLQIFDISSLPDTVYKVYDSNLLLKRAHNCWVDTATARFYTFSVGGAFGFKAMAVYDISNPISPVELASMGSIGNFAFGHVHDGFVRNDTAYLNCGFDGLCVADFSNPTQPQLLGTMTSYQNAGYNHSGWLAPSGGWYYLGDETHGSPVKTVDVQDFSDIHVVDTYNASSSLTQIPHNQVVACNYLYVSYYYDGLQVYDVSDPTDVKRVLYYDTSTEPDGNNYKGAWGVYPLLPSGNILISDMQNGLFVFQSIDAACNALSAAGETGFPSADIKVYPQPAQDVLVLESEALSKEGKLNARLLDLQGRVCLEAAMETGLSRWELKVPQALPNGMYLLQIKSTNINIIYKVLIQKY